MSIGPGPGPGSVGRWAIWIVAVIAIAGVVYVMASVAGVPIPAFVITLFWILLAAVICIGAILFLMRISGSS